jgi:hypothetical protein
MLLFLLYFCFRPAHALLLKLLHCVAGLFPRFLHVHVAGADEASRIRAGRRGGVPFSLAPSHEQHTVLHALELHKRWTTARIAQTDATSLEHLTCHGTGNLTVLEWPGFKTCWPWTIHTAVNSCNHSSSHDKMQSMQRERKYSEEPLAPWTNGIIPGSLPFLGHCWRSALLAAFRLVGFVRTAGQLDSMCRSACAVVLLCAGASVDSPTFASVCLYRVYFVDRAMSHWRTASRLVSSFALMP